jgi:hypothetical protein
VVVHRRYGLLVEEWRYLCRANNVPAVVTEAAAGIFSPRRLATTLSLAIAPEVE